MVTKTVSRTEKLTISLPVSLVAFANDLANEKKISRSAVFSMCLEEFAERRRIAEMEAGYKAMAEEHERFAAMASEIADEVIPEWKP